jgi:hypothetical protein
MARLSGNVGRCRMDYSQENVESQGSQARNQTGRQIGADLNRGAAYLAWNLP